MIPTDLSHDQAMARRRELLCGNRWEGVSRVRRKNGSEFSASLVDSPLFDDSGSFDGVLSISHDVKAALNERLFLQSALNADTDMHSLLNTVAELMRNWSGCNSVKIRLLGDANSWQHKVSGFPVEFVSPDECFCKSAEHASAHHSEATQNTLKNIYWDVIHGRFDSQMPYFTSSGSFWTNCMSDIAASS